MTLCKYYEFRTTSWNVDGWTRTANAVLAALPDDLAGGAALAEAEDAGVLVTEHGRIRFTHPLLASAVYASVSEARRHALHRRLAEVVSDAEERARHLSQSLTDADESAATEIEEAAGQAVLRGYFPKGTDLSVHSPQRLLAIENELNNRPRRVLGDRAPAELFAAVLASTGPSVLRR